MSSRSLYLVTGETGIQSIYVKVSVLNSKFNFCKYKSKDANMLLDMELIFYYLTNDGAYFTFIFGSLGLMIQLRIHILAVSLIFACVIQTLENVLSFTTCVTIISNDKNNLQFGANTLVDLLTAHTYRKGEESLIVKGQNIKINCSCSVC